MDSELKQRLIGAVVVTALATIFIPMLFDDPVDSTGQAVSELTIPTVPATPTSSSANKLPTRAEQVLNQRAGNATSGGAATEAEKIVDTDEETELPAGSKAILAQEDDEPPMSNVVEEDDPNAADDPEAALDTGVVAEAARPNKASKKIAEPKMTAPVSVDAEPLPEPASDKTGKSADMLRWTIQAGTFGQKENALALQESLRKQGLPASVESFKTSKGTTLYKLKVGPSLDKKRAAAMQAVLDKQNIKSILLPQ